MKLKRLELIGFKSFVEKTVVSFDQDITAIVGPNGCGKSNIVDAIRWAVGEQSPKMLRGKSMEDVIFAGSEVRAPLSMASVEITFSTDGYQTPAAYSSHSEISVCRRLYRSGESEYFINKTPVRLKDIHDLFLGTGVGSKAYSTIEQGKVTQFLSARPEERRYYIEEAAGISKFKTRKEAALRKMEATQQNLLRLTDLIIELERQINSLDRQAKKAEKYKEVKTEFQKWDLSLLSYNYQHSNELQENLEKELRRLGEQDLLLKTQLAEGESTLEAERFNLMEKEREINQTQGLLFESTNAIQLAENSLRYKEEEKVRLVARGDEIRKILVELNEQFQKIAENFSSLNDQKLISDLELQQFQEQLSDAEKKVADMQTGLSDLRQTQESLSEQRYSAESRLVQITASRENALLKQKELEEELAAFEAEAQKFQQMQQETSKIYRLAREALESIKQMKFDLNRKTDELTLALNQHRENLVLEEKTLTELREKLTLRKSRLASLEELQRNFEGYAEGTRSVLKRKQENNDEGIVGTVADFVDTSPEYEGAVSAVLGEKLQYVVVKTQQEGLQAVEYLQTAATGRSSFVPMQIRSYGGDSGEMPMREGVIGPLKNFVNIRKEYEHLSDFLFGDVVLVQDINKAIDIWSSNGHRKTLVTLNGEVVDPTGIITGGTSTNNATTLLSMKREIKELVQMIAGLETVLKGREDERAALAKRVEDLANHLDSVKNSSHEEEVKIAHQGKDVDQIKKEQDVLTARQSELMNQTLATQESLSSLCDMQEALACEEKEKRESVEELRVKLESAKGKMEELLKNSEADSEALTKTRVEQAQAASRQVQLETDLKRLQEDQMRVRMEISRSDQELHITEDRLQMLDKDSTHLKKVMNKKLESREEIQTNYTIERNTYEERLTTIRDQELALKEMRRSFEEVTRLLNKVTVDLTEVRSTLKYSVEQCLERHQHNLQDIFTQYYDANLNRAEAEQLVNELREKLSRMGEVNTGALAEYEELKTRFDFLKQQKDDLVNSLDTLEKVIQKINRTTRDRFLETFNLVNEKFQVLFPKLFKGGKARLILTDESNPLETGVDVVASPPGKKLQSINLLSGGEKALTAVSLIFSIFQIKPSPFCILDEVDAPLDDVNVGRYNELLRELTARTQFIVITHNKQTMEMADSLYGVTMQEPGTSQLVSVDLK